MTEKMENLKPNINYFSESLIRNSIDGVIGFDRNFVYNIWNPAIEKITGKNKEEVIGRLPWDTFPFLKKNDEKERMERVLNGESFRVQDLEFIIPETKSSGYYDAQYFPLTDEEGRVTGGMKVIHETTKRKRVEEQLRLKNEQLTEAQEIAIMGNWVFDVATGVNEWSDELYKLYGAPYDKGQNTFDILEKYIFPEDYHKIRQLVTDAVSKGIPYQSQYRITRADGNVRMIATRARPQYNDEGKVTKLKGVCQDITERWEIMEKYKENALLVQQIMESSPNFVFVLDIINQDINYINKTITDVLGYSMEELQNREKEFRLMIVHPDDADMIRERDRKVALAGDKDVLELEYRVRDKWGNWHWLFSKVAVFKRTEDGKVWKVLGIALDITERKRAEEKLLESQLFVSKIAEALPNLLYVYDLNKKKNLYTNKKEIELLGYSSNNFNGMEGILSKVVHQEDRDRLTQHFIKLSNSKDGEAVVSEYRVKNASGEERWLKSNDIVFRRDDKGIPIEIVGSAQDITKRKKAEEELLKLNTELELRVNERTLELSKKNHELLTINNDLDNFIYTASHDLKAPISNIEGLVSTLKGEVREYASAEVNMMFTMIEDSIQRFKDTIKELTEITKIQKDIEDSKEIIRFDDVFRDVQYSLQQLIKDSCPEIFVNFSADHIQFSKKYLRSILYNLVSNGLKYRSPEKTCTIWIDTKFINDQVILSVRDNGLGMRPDQTTKIFSMFKRLHDHVEGTGVGLYIVKRIIDNAGGKIEVESEVGKGSEFRIYFPGNMS